MNSVMKLSWKSVVVATALLLAMPAAIAGEKQSSSELFVSTSESMKFDGKKITFSGINSNVIWFTDRPERKSGNVQLGKFVEAWNSGSDGFKADPPNAVVTIEGRVEEPVIVELSNPKMKGKTLTFDATVLHGSLPASAGQSSVVYDLCWQCIIL